MMAAITETKATTPTMRLTAKTIILENPLLMGAPVPNVNVLQKTKKIYALVFIQLCI